MKTYKLCRDEEAKPIDWCEYDGMIIRAENERQARDIAYEYIMKEKFPQGVQGVAYDLVKKEAELWKDNKYVGCYDIEIEKHFASIILARQLF